MRRHDRAQLRRELESHLDALIRDGLARGLSPAEARREARLAFGSVDAAAEACREVRRFAWLDDLRRDLLHGLRVLRRTPAVTAVAAATLAVAIGATTAVFGLVHALLLAPLPVERPDRLVALSHDVTARGRGLAFPDAFLREIDAGGQPLVAGIVARGGGERVTLGVDGAGEPALGELVSGGFFEVLGVRPAIGRLLTRADDAVRGAHPVVVLSHAFWMRRFGGDPAIVGRTLTISGNPMTVIGVSAAGFDGLDPGQRVDLRAPLAMLAEVRGGRTRSAQRPAGWELQLVARLADGIDLAPAQQALDAAFGRHARAAGLAEPTHLRARPAATGYGRTRDRFGPALGALMALTLAVFAIAVVNVALLIAARAATRQGEWAVRAALGAGWGRLSRQVAAESLLLTALGTALSPAVAWPAASWLARLATGSGSNVLIEARATPAVLGVALLAGLLASLVIAAAAMVRLRQSRVACTAARTSARGSIAAGRHGLIAAQVALTIVVLGGAALFARTIQALRAVDLGLQAEHRLLVGLDPKTAGRADREVVPFYREVRERLLRMPGVTGVSFATARPLINANLSAEVAIEGRAAVSVTALRNAVGPDYFEVTGTPVVAGREFALSDDGDAPKVAVVNEAFVRAHLGGRDPLGLLVGLERPEYRIVGVVGDVRHIHVREAPAPTWYVPYEQRPGLKHLDLVVRTAGDPEQAIAGVRAAIGAVDPRVALFEVRTQQAQLDDLLVSEWILARLAAVFAAIVTGLAALGLYGLLSLAVSQRRRELALRLALGAPPATLLAGVTRDVGRAIAAGLACGLVAAALLGRQAEALLFRVPAIDAASLLIAAGILIAAVAGGAAWPLWRATRIDPVTALREG